MGIKITVDNNFFDEYKNWPNSRDKRNLILAFQQKRFSFYPTAELGAELLGLYKTKRKQTLFKHAEVFLELRPGRFLNAWNKIIRSELGLLKEGVFLDPVLYDQIIRLMEGLKNGEVPENIDEILEKVEEEKVKNFETYKKSQDEHFAKIKKLKIKIPSMTFDEFYFRDFAINIRKDNIKAIFKRAGKEISETLINKINDNPKYPYYFTSARVFMAMFYRHVVLKRKVKASDHYDQYYLIYLTNLDYLVSNDSGIKELARDVFGNENKVITFQELMAMV